MHLVSFRVPLEIGGDSEHFIWDELPDGSKVAASWPIVHVSRVSEKAVEIVYDATTDTTDWPDFVDEFGPIELPEHEWVPSVDDFGPFDAVTFIIKKKIIELPEHEWDQTIGIDFDEYYNVSLNLTEEDVGG